MKRFDESPAVSGLRVEVRNGDFNGALRRFKKLVQDSGLLQELKEKQEFTKPSIKRKKAKAAARSRWLKKLAKSELDFGTQHKRK